MKVSERSKGKAEGEILRKHSGGYGEDGFRLTTQPLLFAAACNRKRFLEVSL